jgi:hypothetical protein
MMNWQLLIPLVITTGVAMLGWFVAHRFNTHRDRQNNRREVRVEYLIEAYRRLEGGADRGAIHNTEYGKGFESAIADVQLFGTVEQVRMAKELASAIAERKEGASAGALLLSLRDDLRKELSLDVINEKPIHFRLKQPGQ